MKRLKTCGSASTVRHVEEMVKKAKKRLLCLRGCRRANLPQEVDLIHAMKLRSVPRSADIERLTPIFS